MHSAPPATRRQDEVSTPLHASPPIAYERRKTHAVFVGDLGMGGTHPLRLQSMTTTTTLDTKNTVEQIIRLHEAGSEAVRLAVPSLKEAENLRAIKEVLKKRNLSTLPLIADIHFTPRAAEEAARVVEKVRINPGNYAEKKVARIAATGKGCDESIAEEVRKHFLPLLAICKQYGTTLRIGTNHGSLSERMLFRYGDTPLGMVESAIEYAKICQEEGFKNVVLSMKASQPQLMLAAYRLLVRRLREDQLPDYPLHLGVTEAGDGEDGRIKSALGIGTLLAEGIGDTLRVSLTEPPENELPVARAIIRHSTRGKKKPTPRVVNSFSRRAGVGVTHKVLRMGGEEVPRVIIDGRSLLQGGKEQDHRKALRPLGHQYLPALDKWALRDQACDYLYMGSTPFPHALPQWLHEVIDYELWREMPPKEHCFPLVSLEAYATLRAENRAVGAFLSLGTDDVLERGNGLPFDAIKGDQRVVLVLLAETRAAYLSFRQAVVFLRRAGIRAPILLRQDLSRRDPRRHACASQHRDGGQSHCGPWAGSVAATQAARTLLRAVACLWHFAGGSSSHIKDGIHSLSFLWSDAI